MKRGDWFLFFGFLLIIAAMFMIGFYYYGQNVNKCISDPMKFGVESIRENYDADYVYGSITFLKDGVSRSWDFGDEIFSFNISS